MNAYTTRGRARIQPGDLAAVQRKDWCVVGASLAALERQRGCQAEAEVAWLLKQHAVEPRARASIVSLLRQRIGEALVRTGDRLAGLPRRDVSPETASAAAGTPGGTPAW